MSVQARRRHPRPTVAPPQAGTCPVSGKRRWTSRAHARLHLRQLKGRGKGGTGLGTYRCASGCGDWHVGHRVKGAQT